MRSKGPLIRWIILLVAFVFWTGCETTIPEYTVVYTAGNLLDYEGNEFPCYWRDAELHELPILDGAKGGKITGLAIAGNTVYLSGTCTTGNGFTAIGDGFTVPCMWKNDQLIELPLQQGECSGVTHDIFVYDGDVYVVGNTVKIDSNGYCFGRVTAWLWKNGERSELPNPEPGFSTYADAVWVTENNLYICGSVYSKYAHMPNLCLWTNGSPHLFNMYYYGFGDLLVTQGTSSGTENVYITGTSYVPIWLAEPFVYINGKYCILPVPDDHNGNQTGIANAMATNGLATFILGREGDGKNCFWKDFQRNYFNPEISMRLNALDISLGEMYVVGDSGFQPCYWKGNQQVLLDKPSKPFVKAQIQSIRCVTK